MNFDLSTIQDYLSTIQLHLDNFVNTQEGWYKILSGVTEILRMLLRPSTRCPNKIIQAS